MNQISKFEKHNQHLNFKINIYGYNDLDYKNPDIIPIRISKMKSKKIVDLLLYDDHYYLVNNFNRLCGNQAGHFHYFCRNCLLGFKSNLKLVFHEKMCNKNKSSKIVMPEKNEIMQFSDFKNELGN